MWKHGPGFLWKGLHEWSQQPTDEGVKKERVTLTSSVVKEDFWDEEVKKSSGLANSSIAYASETVNRTSRVGCIFCETGGEDTPLFIVRIRRSRQKNLFVQYQAFHEELSKPDGSKGPLANIT